MNRNQMLCALLASCVFAGADQPKKKAAKRVPHAPRVVGPERVPPAPVVVAPESTSKVLAEQERRANVYRGTTSSPHPKAAGAALALHEDVGKTLSKLDHVPQQRLQHFAWVSEVNAKINAWHLTVENAEPISGGWRAQVQARPSLSPSSTLFTNDRLTETYEYRNGKLTLVNVEEPTEPRYTVYH